MLSRQLSSPPGNGKTLERGGKEQLRADLEGLEAGDMAN
jgi:hypothetical protein